MARQKSFPTRIILSVALAMLAGRFTAVPAHADPDPELQPIIQTIEGDRFKACPNSGILGGDKKLEAIAQAYARSENVVTLPPPPPGHQRLLPFLGSGDPQAKAINDAYRHGAGQPVGTCSEFAYGVGFVRHGDRSVDVVTIVYGELTPPRHPASIRLKPGAQAFYVSGSGFSPRSTVSLSFNYVTDGNLTGEEHHPIPVDSAGNFADTIVVRTMGPHGRLGVYTEDSGVLSATKTIQF